MRKFVASFVTAVAVIAAGPVTAADMPEYPEFDIPEVDYGLGGSFYLRGSAGLNLHWAQEARHGAAWAGQIVHPIDSLGFGYSWGAGFGYETGDGLRFDATIDTLETRGLGITKAGLPPPDVNGKYSLSLRSTVALANIYYDFGFGGGNGLGGFGYTGEGGAFGYVGLGAGVAWNHTEVNTSPLPPAGDRVPNGGNVSAAAAVMAGVGYDMGNWVADVGYRGLYINSINNAPTDPVADPGLYYQIDNNWIHEVRGTIRYRFN